MASEEAANPGEEDANPGEEDANPGAQPAAPASRKKSRKKGKEKPGAREAAREGGQEASGRAARVEGLTRAGCQALALGDARGAVGSFREALRLCGGTASPRLRRACAFRLGAAYVESGKPQKGLRFLLQSLPAERESERHEGDLDFNTGAARGGLGGFPKALERFGQGVGPDGAVGAGGRAGTRVRPGRRSPEAARSYAEAAAAAPCGASGSRPRSRRFGAAEIAGVLARCRSLCDSLPDPALRGDAAAPPPCTVGGTGAARARPRRGRRPDGSPVIPLPGSLGNRRAQGQCFGNLAYACSRLGSHEAAAESYLHALRAFRDCGDVQGQWQACEGLGAASLHLGDPQKAIEHYKEALTLLSCCQDAPRGARERVVHRLTEAIGHQLCLYGRLPRRDPGQLQFCPTLPHTSGTRLRGSEVSFRRKPQPGNEPHVPVPGARPGRSGRGAAVTDGPTLKLRSPRGPLDTSGEDGNGPGVAPRLRRDPHAKSPTADPADTGCWPHGKREPRGGSRILSLVCSLL